MHIALRVTLFSRCLQSLPDASRSSPSPVFTKFSIMFLSEFFPKYQPKSSVRFTKSSRFYKAFTRFYIKFTRFSEFKIFGFSHGVGSPAMFGHENLQQFDFGLDLFVLGVRVIHVAPVVFLHLRTRSRSGQGQVKEAASQ